MLEVFSHSKVKCFNYPIVIHRTTSQAQKRAEALGRPEGAFMTGGSSKLGNFFGPTYVASLFRLIERAGYSVSELFELPEKLFLDLLLID